MLKVHLGVRCVHVLMNRYFLQVHGLLVLSPISFAVPLLLCQHLVVGLEVFVRLVTLGGVLILSETTEASYSVSPVSSPHLRAHET